MTIETFIEKLQAIQKNMPGAIVKYGDVLGPDISPRILCMQCEEAEKLKFVCIVDAQAELEMMFDQYYGRLQSLGVTEELFYKDLLNDFTLEDVKKYVSERYEQAKEFCEAHKLV